MDFVPIRGEPKFDLSTKIRHGGRKAKLIGVFSASARKFGGKTVLLSSEADVFFSLLVGFFVL